MLANAMDGPKGCYIDTFLKRVLQVRIILVLFLILPLQGRRPLPWSRGDE